MSFFFMPALSSGLPQQEPLLRSSLAPRGGQCPTPHTELLSLFFFATITIISLVVVFGRTPKKLTDRVFRAHAFTIIVICQTQKCEVGNFYGTVRW